PFGRLLWLALGDPATLPQPFAASWMPNRVSIDSKLTAGPTNMPKGALRPEAGSGELKPVRGKAQQRLRFSAVGSAFHDGSKMGVADAVYPYVFAFKWSAETPENHDVFEPKVAQSLALAREWLAGFKVIGVTTQTRNFGSDLQFKYSVPIVDV